MVLGFPKGRGFIAASFSLTTPRPPLKGALVAALPFGVEILLRSLQKSKPVLCFLLACYVYLPLRGRNTTALVAKIKAGALLFTRLLLIFAM